MTDTIDFVQTSSKTISTSSASSTLSSSSSSSSSASNEKKFLSYYSNTGQMVNYQNNNLNKRQGNNNYKEFNNRFRKNSNTSIQRPNNNAPTGQNFNRNNSYNNINKYPNYNYQTNYPNTPTHFEDTNVENFYTDEEKKFKKNLKQTSPKSKETVNTNTAPNNNTITAKKLNNSKSQMFNVNYNYQYQQAPFQPPSYHQSNSYNNLNKNYVNHQPNQPHNNNNHNHHHNNNSQKNRQLIDKYNRKYNLISFILLRKNDEYLTNFKYYLNDQSLYQQIDLFIENRDLTKLSDLFSKRYNFDKINSELMPGNDNFSNSNLTLELESFLVPAPDQATDITDKFKLKLSNFTNSYNCNLFVYTIRKLLEHESSLLKKDENNNTKSNKTIESEFVKIVLELLFSVDCIPESLYLIDGEYPRRNIMHYAARYNCTLIPKLILEGNNEETQLNGGKDDGEDGDEEEEAGESEKYTKADYILVELCMQVDFNGNTPIHIAAANNSYEFLKLITPLCLKYAQLISNEDGLSPFLLASRFSSVKLIKLIVEKITLINHNLDISLLMARDRVNLKNCLHYACGRGCSSESLEVVSYLTNLAKNNNENLLYELIGAISPLLGSVYHVAASNLTRVSTLWYLLNLYPIKSGLINENKSILNKLDFREFTCVDSLIDSVMNLREMAPPNCRSLTDFYHELNSDIDNFDILLNKCIYKLLIDCKAIILNMPRIKNKWQLLEFFKLFVFMCKFISTETYEYTQHTATFDTIHSIDFEGYAINFFHTFILTCDFFKNVNERLRNPSPNFNFDSMNNVITESINSDDYFILNELLNYFDELTDIVLFTDRFTPKFKNKMLTFIKTCLLNLRLKKETETDDQFCNSNETLTPVSIESINSPKFSMNKSNEIKNVNEFNCELILNVIQSKLDNYFNVPMSLKVLCRFKINQTIKQCGPQVRSALDPSYVLFKLPVKYSSLINYLSFNIIHDLYGTKFDLSSIK